MSIGKDKLKWPNETTRRVMEEVRSDKGIHKTTLEALRKEFAED